MTRAIVIFCVAILLAAGLLHEGKQGISTPKIPHPVSSFDEIYTRYSIGGSFGFFSDSFFSGPSEIKIQSNGKIAINNRATNGWIYGQLTNERVVQTLDKINEANFQVNKRKGGCDLHGDFFEVAIIISGTKYIYSNCDQSFPDKLYSLSHDIFQLSEEFISSAFIALANQGIFRAASELSYKFVSKPTELEKTGNTIKTNDVSVRQAYFWACVARSIAQKTDSFFQKSKGVSLYDSHLQSRISNLESKLDDESLSEMSKEVEMWRAKYLNNIPLNEGNNK